MSARGLDGYLEPNGYHEGWKIYKHLGDDDEGDMSVMDDERNKRSDTYWMVTF